MKKPNVKATALQQKVDALVEFVHRGGASLLDANEVYGAVLHALHPNCSANFEYRFAWNDNYGPDDLKINWKRLKKRILQKVVKSTARKAKIYAGAKLTVKENQAYCLEIARKEHGYKTSEERLESNDNCKWVDLSYIVDSQKRRIYFLEMGEADSNTDDEIDAMSPKEITEWHKNVWQWKRQGISVFGPFHSEEEAEEWMEKKGAFDDGDE